MVAVTMRPRVSVYIGNLQDLHSDHARIARKLGGRMIRAPSRLPDPFFALNRRDNICSTTEHAFCRAVATRDWKVRNKKMALSGFRLRACSHLATRAPSSMGRERSNIGAHDGIQLSLGGATTE